MPVSAANFKPCLWKEGEDEVIFLPRPIVSGGPQWRWKKHLTEIPMVAGALVDSPSMQGTPITLSGLFDLEDGTVVYTEADMWAYYKRLLAYMNVTDDERLELFLYYDADAEVYEKFISVTPESFQVNLGDQPGQLWSWTGTWFAEDPTIYQTEPGS